MTHRILVLAVAVLLTAGAVRSLGAGEPVPEASDHAALAAMYAGEAKVLRQKVAEHQLMLRRYENAAQFQKSMPFPKAALVQHCRKLVASYEEAASNAETLAKMEAELARPAPASR